MNENSTAAFRHAISCHLTAKMHGLHLHENGGTAISVLKDGTVLHNAQSIEELRGWLECYHDLVAKSTEPMPLGCWSGKGDGVK